MFHWGPVSLVVVNRAVRILQFRRLLHPPFDVSDLPVAPIFQNLLQCTNQVSLQVRVFLANECAAPFWFLESSPAWAMRYFVCM